MKCLYMPVCMYIKRQGRIGGKYERKREKERICHQTDGIL